MYSENTISKKFRVFADKNEWLISGEYIYGDEQGYLFSGLDGKGEKIFLTPVPAITDDQKAELFAALEKNRATMKLASYAIADDFLCVRIKDSARLKTDDLEFIIALLVGTLQDLSIVTAGRCQECGKMGADTEDFVYDLYCYMHKDCAAKFKAESAVGEGKEASDSEEEASGDGENDADKAVEQESSKAVETPDAVPMWKKIVFTAGGAIVGSIPWLALPYILGWVGGLIEKITANTIVGNLVQSLLTCICAYLVSYFAILGYRLSKSRMNRKGRWIVGIVSVAAVILIQFAYVAVLIYKEPSVALTWDNYITNIAKSAIYINLLLGILIGTVFTLISVLPFFDTSVSSSKKAKQIAAKRAAAVGRAEGDEDEEEDACECCKDEAAGEEADSEDDKESKDDNGAES